MATSSSKKPAATQPDSKAPAAKKETAAKPKAKAKPPVELDDLDESSENTTENERTDLDDLDLGADLTEVPSDEPSDTATEPDAASTSDSGLLLDRLSSGYGETPRVSPTQTKAEDSGEQFLQLPPCLDIMETTENPTSVKIVVEAHSTNCLNCSHLHPEGQKEFTKCHFSNGNATCPAQSVKIIFVGRRAHFLNSLRDAKVQKDTNKVLRILAKLEEEPLDLKTFVLENAGLL